MSQLVRTIIKPIRRSLLLQPIIHPPPPPPQFRPPPSAFYSISPHRQMESSRRQPPSPQTLQMTEACKKRLKEILNDSTFLRISVEGGGCSGFQYKFEIDKNLVDSEDVILGGDNDTALVVIDKTSLDILRGSTLDYERELIRSAFRIINNPQAEQGCSCGASFNMKID